ncbi:pilus assembly protein PilN [Candidatus Endobugula sertula]|uniref:Pilus assembly protein PilN n=1 Tax=Candidatus Endobugula sertula TaxID=62101 RepID=A0A1D2QRU4_9GAMM|nr:pilus assembly protein PilN [Candidatus Endobugula sertula]
MATINLLPWRDEYHKEKTREFFSILILLVILTILVGYVWYAFIHAEISTQRSRNALFEKEIAILESKENEIKKLKKQRADLESKMEIIQNLQNERPLIVHYFDELVKAVPDGVYLKQLQRKEHLFSVKGHSESNNRVSTLMRNIERSDYFQSPNLKNVVKADFELTFNSEREFGSKK